MQFQDKTAGLTEVNLDGNDILPRGCDRLCPCEKSIRRKDPYWICRFCLYVGFYEDCVALVKADKIGFNICSPQRSWMLFRATSKVIPAD